MKKEKQMVRVRFAPSPTGYLHIGSFRTALFNWLFARHNGGEFLVRIEDTDIERSKQEYTDAIADALAWINIKADEPIVLQSDRFSEHTKLVEQLLAQGKAYKDFYTQDEFFELYKQKHGTADFAKAYSVCRDQDQNQDKPYVVRFKLLLDRKEVCFDDVIRGNVCFAIEQLDDFVIARSDSRPMYNFVVVADDIHQRITHVIRGEDHIPNTPKQILLYEALGAEQPTFAHLPLILGKSGNRLSKRDAATSVMDYKEQGYLPDALLNYLVRLGWAHGDQEVFSRDQLIELFQLKNVGKKGSIFDQEKLDWLNGLYIRDTDDQKLLNIIYTIKPDFAQTVDKNDQELCAFIALYKERAKTVVELADAIIDVHSAPTEYDQDACGKWTNEHTANDVTMIIQLLESAEAFNLASIKEQIVGYAKKENKKLGTIAQPIRIALVGGSSSPSVFELLALLGKSESLARLKQFVLFLNQRA
jgi:glutamyl-tRNA synthetase